MSAICKHYYVTGKVQGVFYRRHAYQEAITLGLTGWTRNLDDGRVEVMLCGEPEKVALMEAWLWEGPDRANVSNVEVLEVAPQTFTTFEVL